MRHAAEYKVVRRKHGASSQEPDTLELMKTCNTVSWEQQPRKAQ